MPPAARITDMHVCPMQTPAVVPIPHVGGPLTAACPNVMICMTPASRVSHLLVCVGPPDLLAMGSFTVLIGGLPAARIGDMPAHAGALTVGCPTVMIG